MIQNKTVIAITGGIGSGKSSVCAILRRKGYKTFDCDIISKEVSKDSQVVEQISKTFGQDFVINGKINRAKMREEILIDEEKTKQLNKIFHQRIYESLEQKINDEPSNLVFVEVSVAKAIVREFFDDVWIVDAPIESRVKRVVFRDNVSAEQVEAIAKKQMTNLQGKVIVNDKFVEDLKPQIEFLLSQY